MASLSGYCKNPSGEGRRRSGAELAALIAKKQRRDIEEARRKQMDVAQESFTSDISTLVDAFEGAKGSVEGMEFFAARLRGVVSGFFAEFAEDTAASEEVR